MNTLQINSNDFIWEQCVVENFSCYIYKLKGWGHQMILFVTYKYYTVFQSAHKVYYAMLSL